MCVCVFVCVVGNVGPSLKVEVPRLRRAPLPFKGGGKSSNRGRGTYLKGKGKGRGKQSQAK